MPAESLRLPVTDVDSLDEARSAVVQTILAGRGRLPTPFRVWLASPELARGMHGLGDYFAHGSSLSEREAEVVILVLARHWNGDYVEAVHSLAAQQVGVDDGTIAAIARRDKVASNDVRLNVVVDLLMELAAPGTPSDEVFQAAVGVLGQGGVADVLALAGYFTAVTLAMKLYAVPPPGKQAASSGELRREGSQAGEPS